MKLVENDGEFTFETVTNDPLRTRIYTLQNGLRVYLTVYKDKPRIQTSIAVKAGSKFDPHETTGLAHYLEHMVFKGTSHFGTKDFQKEKEELNKIEELYEVYRTKTDPAERKKLYHQIDSISGVAASLAIAQEYDKMVGTIGAQYTNAYTSVEQTVYVNDIPSNELERWLMIEGERFGELVLRLFHTELEAVYEEKNRTLDNDRRKCFEKLFKEMFQKHTYGTQTTIGTIEHLKNPSMKKIHQYFDTYYVPNNMAMCLSGDFEPSATIRLVNKYFGNLKPKKIPEYVPPVENPIAQPIESNVYGYDAESVMLGFRFPGNSNKDVLVMEMINDLLLNESAGLIDLDLNQKQLVLEAGSFPVTMKDYSMHVLWGHPREGQTLENLKQLLMQEIEKIKKGDFPDWLLPAVISDYKLRLYKKYEDNSERADALVEAFTMDMDWKNFASKISDLSKITKQDIIRVANHYYGNNYVAVYKRTGPDTVVQKVDKPSITPVTVNREEQSDFVKNIYKVKPPRLKPVFLDFKQDIKELKIHNDVSVYYKKNEENPTFSMYYYFDFGKNVDPKIEIAVKYLEFLGTEKYSAEQFSQELYKLGCQYNVFVSNEQMWINLSGLEENFQKAISLFEQLLAQCKPDQTAFLNMIDGIIKERNDAKLSKNVILFTAMQNYARYGGDSPFTNVLSDEQLKSLSAEQLIFIIRSLSSLNHRILYYGTQSEKQITGNLGKHHLLPEKLFPIPVSKKFTEQDTKENKVFWVNYKDMVQAELMFVAKSVKFDKNIVPVASLFNEYFGEGMSSLVFQELRESRALAYSVSSRFRAPASANECHYLTAYIGTQADKLNESLNGMLSLLDNMPLSENIFNMAKNSILGTMETERITKSDILFEYEKAKKRGLDFDLRKDIYGNVQTFTLNDVKKFSDEYVKNKPRTLLVLGSKDKINFKTLEKYGKIQELTLKDIFGY